MFRIRLPFQIKIYLLLFLLFALLLHFTTTQVNHLVSESIYQENVKKFEELKSIFYNLLGFKIQSIENEALLLAEQQGLLTALERQQEPSDEKSFRVEWLPGAQRREWIVITNQKGQVIDGSITVNFGDKVETVQDTETIQGIVDSWQPLQEVLLGYMRMGYITVSAGPRKTLFALASSPIIDPQQPEQVWGSISVGFPVDQSLAKDLRRGSRYQIGFILDNRIVASTFNIEKLIDFATVWDDMPLQKKESILNKAEEINLFNERYLAYAAPLPVQGETEGLYVILSPLEETFTLLSRLNRAILYVSLLILVIVMVIAYILAKNVTSPVRTLAHAVSQIAQENYDVHVSIKTGDELETLGVEIQNMASIIQQRNREIKNYIQQIEESNKELENRIAERTQDLEEKNFRLRMISEELGRAYARIDDELKVVGELQKNLLPRHSFEIEGLTFRSVYIPNGRAGGDYYDYLSPDPNQLYILIADVSGHGTPAAFIMGIVRAITHTLIEQRLSPQKMLKQLSTVLLKTLRSGEFVTMFLARLNLETFQLDFSSAGHQPPLLTRKSNSHIEELTVEHGLPLGIMEDADYDQMTTVIEPGDRLVLYTDGVIEAFNEKKKPYEIRRLKSILNHTRELNPDDLLDTVLDDLEAFVQHPLDIEPLEDDVTLLVIDFHFHQSHSKSVVVPPINPTH